MLQWNESKTYTKREFCQILAREFGTIRLAEMHVSLWGKRFFFLEKRCFYEHGSRSAGMFMYIYIIIYNYIIDYRWVCLNMGPGYI